MHSPNRVVPNAAERAPPLLIHSEMPEPPCPSLPLVQKLVIFNTSGIDACLQHMILMTSYDQEHCFMSGNLGKTAGVANRKAFIGGSAARIIVGDDEGALLRLWREKRGEVEPEDLSGNLVVQLGVATERLNRRWYEARTGEIITDVQAHMRHATLRWMAATLDGRLKSNRAIFEAKFMLPWSFSEEAAAQKYTPQLQHNMWVFTEGKSV